MAESPEERLARLRREVESTWSPPSIADADRSPDLGLTPPPSPAPDGAPERTPAVTPVPAGPEPVPAPAPAPSAPMPPPSPAPPAPAEPPVRAAPPDEPPRPSPDDGWSLAEALGGASLGTWIGVGLLVVGGYLVLAWFIPGIGFPGSIVMAGAGLLLLWQHFGHRAGPWALYAGMILAFIGGLRVLGDLLPFDVHGETSLGLGLALLTIAWLRHTQAGGWGWQGVVGAVVLAWGALQLGVGLLPGTPGLLDLVLPVVLLGVGGWLLLRAMRGRRPN